MGRESGRETGIMMLQMWSKARELAVMTPPERNRWVDFLRAISIMAVVFGHQRKNTSRENDTCDNNQSRNCSGVTAN